MNTNMAGFRWFLKLSLHSCASDESSLSIKRIKGASNRRLRPLCSQPQLISSPVNTKIARMVFGVIGVTRLVNVTGVSPWAASLASMLAMEEVGGGGVFLAW